MPGLTTEPSSFGSAGAGGPTAGAPDRGTAGWLLAAAVLTAGISTGAIVATYSQLSHTWDEGTHVSAGLEWLQDGRYTFQTENPPLSRIPLAVIPYLNGARIAPPDQRIPEPTYASDAVFYRSRDYIRNVTEGRVANLIFFWACISLTWILAGGRTDPWVAFLASAAVATLPPVVAHSGFATTDIPFLASFLLAALALKRLLVVPSLRSAAVAGAALGIAVATKFSTIVFLPPLVAAVLILHVAGRRWSLPVAAVTSWGFWRTVAVMAGAGALTIWASYGFAVGRLSDLSAQFGGLDLVPDTSWLARVRDWRLPGHEFLHGLLSLRAHTISGHRAVLFDEFSARGFLLFYPVVLAVKTPVPFLLFAAAGLASLIRARHAEHWRWFAGFALGALGILCVSMASPINLGVRHVLVIYPLVALAAAFGIVRLAERSARTNQVLGAAVGLVVAQTALLLSSVPYQVSYFNVFGGSDPGYISSDSDLDWGQHAIALERYFAEHPVPELYVLLNGTTRTCDLKLPPVKALPRHPVTGWIAVSERPFRLNRGAVTADPCVPSGMPGRMVRMGPGWLDWLKPYKPVTIIGKTVRLYHITELP